MSSRSFIHEHTSKCGRLIGIRINYSWTEPRPAVVNADPDSCHPAEGGVEVNWVAVAWVDARPYPIHFHDVEDCKRQSAMIEPVLLDFANSLISSELDHTAIAEIAEAHELERQADARALHEYHEGN